MPHRVGIALGSNLGDRLRNLRAARDLVADIAVPGTPVLEAAIYETAPVGCPEGSPDFYNTVIEVSYEGTAEELLDRTQAFQHELGRPLEAPRNAPRVIDIDLLYFGDQRVVSDRLELPHPRLTQRRFVLQPLADIRPELRLPGDGKTVREHLEALGDEEILQAAVTL
jgi:2-amino-4-hydroxy-6-hydroxymethyldihydropteridine diphosphokinase